MFDIVIVKTEKFELEIKGEQVTLTRDEVRELKEKLTKILEE